MLAVASAVREARRRPVSTVSLFTASAGPFFEQLGFRRVARKELPESVRNSGHAAEECAQSATPMLLALK
jgi:N-acetylglutamate synthase-like GNAT family acetyltransferase